MEPIEIVEEFDGVGVRLEDARCQHGEAIARAFATGDWAEVCRIAEHEERARDRAA